MQSIHAGEGVPGGHTSLRLILSGVYVARRMSSRALLKFLWRSSISHHSHHTVARSSTYLKATCTRQLKSTILPKGQPCSQGFTGMLCCGAIPGYNQFIPTCRVM